MLCTGFQDLLLVPQIMLLLVALCNCIVAYEKWSQDTFTLIMTMTTTSCGELRTDIHALGTC